ncbi:uncharacterized protein LOC122725096 [Manihot esculenta]|uniref:uncharacterized protein LOC122725096 n=1 Tax=Manihot esculenta TaxID=3983 RepID=UPI001CC6B0BF|nr:uncharacterized protein LOC122725096 [Manihot esculenta]
MNFKKEFPGLMLRDDFWNAAKSTHSYEFWLHMKNLKPKRDQKPYDWLINIPFSQWTRHAFWPEAKCDNYTNNMTESFNAWIVKLRGLPIINIIESIRQKCMVRLHRRFAKAQTWEGIVTPRTKKVLNKIITASRFLKLLPGRNEEYEVHEGPCRFAVSLAKRTCSCGWWDISGLPCKHAARAIAYVRGNIEEFCHEYYTVQCYSRVYAGAIHPVPQTELEPDNEHPSMLPPPLRRQPGRPRKARKRDQSEPPARGKRTATVTCARCLQTGHNKRTCQYAAVGANMAASQKKRKHTTASGAGTSRGVNTNQVGSSGGPTI